MIQLKTYFEGSIEGYIYGLHMGDKRKAQTEHDF